MLRVWLKSDINEICASAQNKYAGDKIEALISLINSDIENLEDKNHAIWVLGKLNDKRALPVLKLLQSTYNCDHTYFVCQREVEKAINNLEGNSFDILTFN